MPFLCKYTLRAQYASLREIDGGGHHPHIGHKTRVSPLLIQTGLAVSRSLKLEVDTPTNNGHLKLERRVAVVWRRQEEYFVPRVPGWSEAGKWAALEAARSSTRGGGWAPSGLVSPVGAPSQPELPGAPSGGA